MYFSIFCVLIIIIIRVYFLSFFKTKQSPLPVIKIGPIGNPPSKTAVPKSQWISPKRIGKLLALLNKKHFNYILPADIVSGKLPKRPVLLVFADGYQTIYQKALPLLEKYRAKAAVALPAGLIGQYDAWHTEGPWQNILTSSDIKALQQSGLVEFISQGINAQPLHSLPLEMAVWQLQESKSRLQHLYDLNPQAMLLPDQQLPPAVLLYAAKKEYPLLIGPHTGLNRWPLPHSTLALSVFPLTRHTPLHRFCWCLTHTSLF